MNKPRRVSTLSRKWTKRLRRAAERKVRQVAAKTIRKYLKENW